MADPYRFLDRSALVAAIARLESELATLRSAATRVPPDTDVDLVAQAIHSALCTPLTCVSAEMYDAAARAVLAALAGAGRLRDEGDGYWMGQS